MNIRFLPRVVVTFGLALLVGCGTPDTAGQTGLRTSAQPTLNTTATTSSTDASGNAATQLPVAGSVSYDIVRSLDKAVAEADIIIIGKFVGLGKIFNSARDNRDPTKCLSE